MNIEKIVVGSLEANCYIVSNLDKCIIIDPGAEFPKIQSAIGTRKIVGIFITHTHEDHIGALKELKNWYDVPINPEFLEGFNYKIINTPGHYFDEKTFYFMDEKIMFTGDFLFKGTFGRVDMPGSDKFEMKKSLELIKKYPGDIIIYPGHGEESLLQSECVFFDQYIKYLDYNL